MTQTTSTLDGYFKRRYGTALDKPIAEFAIVAEDIPFVEAQKMGASYEIPVRTRRSMGWTFDASGGTAFVLNAAVTGQTKPARVTSAEFVLRESIAYAVAARAQDSEQAFGDAVDETVEDMTESAAFAREMMLLYGQTHIGAIESQTGSSTARALVISKATWAPGLWAQAEGMVCDVYENDLVTKLNADDAVIVGLVDDDTRTINVTGDASDLSAIDTAIASGDANFVPKGWLAGSFKGLDVIAGNSGSLFEIDAATYGVQKGNSVSVGSVALSLGRLLSASTKSTVRGGMGKLVAYLNTYSWQDLNNDHAALRRIGNEGKSEVVLGTKKITYIGPNGTLELKPHPMVMAGRAYVIPVEKCERRGSTDLTFNIGHGGQDKFFRELDGQAGFELRTYWDQCLFARRINRFVKLTGIVNSSL